jgi:nucleoside-diphosphate-sugar epimerase
MRGPAGETILLLGGNGYIGRMLAAALLAETEARLILPVRDRHSPASVVAAIARELPPELPSAGGERVPRPAAKCPPDLRRLEVLPLPAPGRIASELAPLLRARRVREIVHAAGSVSYFNTAKLKAGNIDLTREIIALGRNLPLERLSYVSTAFCSGFRTGPIAEVLHDDSGVDPTDYTRTKRQAEHELFKSGLPVVILRPSVVVGDSRSGHYSGRPYGLYQFWSGAERFLCDRWRPVVHFFAPPERINFVHQDALQAVFLGCRRLARPGAIVHVVSRDQTLPTMCDLVRLWMLACARPRELYLYERQEDMPAGALDASERQWSELVAANAAIAAHHWDFERTALESLAQGGLTIADATVETVARCQAAFLRGSARVQEFMARCPS